MKTKYLLGLFALTVTGVCHADWRYPHGDGANTGFSNTATAAAGAPSRIDQAGSLQRARVQPVLLICGRYFIVLA